MSHLTKEDAQYGHMTGQVRGGGGRPEFQKGPAKFLSWSTDLAKLNPKYHMNYSNYL